MGEPTWNESRHDLNAPADEILDALSEDKDMCNKDKPNSEIPDVPTLMEFSTQTKKFVLKKVTQKLPDVSPVEEKLQIFFKRDTFCSSDIIN